MVVAAKIDKKRRVPIYRYVALGALGLYATAMTILMLVATLQDPTNHRAVGPSVVEGIWEASSTLRGSNSNIDSNHTAEPTGHGSKEQDPRHKFKAAISDFLSDLWQAFSLIEHPSSTKVWSVYHSLAVRYFVSEDSRLKGQLPYHLKNDSSIFISMASYRDKLCPATLEEIFSKAAVPQKIQVGLVQQNCDVDCETFQELTPAQMKQKPKPKPQKIKQNGPDIDCAEAFCKSGTNAALQHCSQIDVIRVNYLLATGPCPARYFASKMWSGQTYYMQIDSHIVFVQNWDKLLLGSLKRAPSPRPVLSQYPPGVLFPRWQSKPGYRICGARIQPDLNIRLEASQLYEWAPSPEPRYAPFIAAGFFLAPATFLAVAPFDPLLPWVFSGEEIHLSFRFWTHGYDIFSPGQNYLAHYYSRIDQPKFYEAPRRLFAGSGQIWSRLQRLVTQRIKHVVGYPEFANASQLAPPSLAAAALGVYGPGDARPPEGFHRVVNVDLANKRTGWVGWCQRGAAPAPEEVTATNVLSDRSALAGPHVAMVEQ
uniref:Uncharacterized protein n=1 Tax=Heterosigma akashiwo TaxID=2829 RepID=A0A7S3UTW3_HETAK